MAPFRQPVKDEYDDQKVDMPYTDDEFELVGDEEEEEEEEEEESHGEMRPDNAADWFTKAEGIFKRQGIAHEQNRMEILFESLNSEVYSLIADVYEGPEFGQLDQPYTVIKETILHRIPPVQQNVTA